MGRSRTRVRDNSDAEQVCLHICAVARILTTDRAPYKGDPAELGTSLKSWDFIEERILNHDEDMIANLTDDIDTLLVFVSTLVVSLVLNTAQDIYLPGRSIFRRSYNFPHRFARPISTRQLSNNRPAPLPDCPSCRHVFPSTAIHQ